MMKAVGLLALEVLRFVFSLAGLAGALYFVYWLGRFYFAMPLPPECTKYTPQWMVCTPPAAK